jgi:cytochrome c oxidase subunit III
MAIVIPEPPQISDRLRDYSGTGGKNLIPTGAKALVFQNDRFDPAQTGMWVALAAITMSFAALTSALVVRQGIGVVWGHIIFPPILFSNTFVLLASSVTLEFARRRITSYARGIERNKAVPMRWLAMTLFLGLLFIGGQYAVWLQLKSQGLYLATNTSSSFFYLFTGVHAVHILGGLLGLVYVMSKFRRSVLRRSTFAACAQYWHFMDALWLYLLLLLWVRI